MAAKTRAYVDTSAFIALLDGSDSHHSLFLRLFGSPPALVTTSLVLTETHGWFLRRFDPHRALQFLAFTDQLSVLDVRTIGRDDLVAAGRWLRRFRDQPLTLVDAMGLELMKRDRIRSCWSTDRHLSLSGATLAIHEA